MRKAALDFITNIYFKKYLVDKNLPENTKQKDINPSELKKIIKAAKNDESYKAIIEMVGKNDGYLYAWVRFHFRDGVELTVLKELLETLTTNRQYKSQLPQNIDSYAAYEKGSVENDVRSGGEILYDDIQILIRKQKAKSWIDNLYNKHRSEYRLMVSNNITRELERVENIALGFDSLGVDDDGNFDPIKNKSLSKYFFAKSKDYDTLNVCMLAAEKYIEASSNNKGYSAFIQNVHNLNEQVGEANGITVTFDNGEIVIVDINSYYACNKLFSHSSWCIARAENYWNSYNRSSETDFRKQVGIMNFTVPSTNPEYTIGITFSFDTKTENCKVHAAHDKSDGSMMNKLAAYYKKYNIVGDAIPTITKEQIEIKKRRIAANKKIILDKITIADLDKCLEDGADINATGCKALINSINEENIEKARYILQKGGLLTAKNAESFLPIHYVKSFEMLKLLVSSGSPIPSNIISQLKLCQDINVIKYLIQNGLSPLAEQSRPLREAALVSSVDIFDYLLEKGGNPCDRDFQIFERLPLNPHFNGKIIDYMIKIHNLIQEGRFKITTKDFTYYQSSYNIETNKFTYKIVRMYKTSLKTLKLKDSKNMLTVEEFQEELKSKLVPLGIYEE